MGGLSQSLVVGEGGGGGGGAGVQSYDDVGQMLGDLSSRSVGDFGAIAETDIVCKVIDDGGGKEWSPHPLSAGMVPGNKLGSIWTAEQGSVAADGDGYPVLSANGQAAGDRSILTIDPVDFKRWRQVFVRVIMSKALALGGHFLAGWRYDAGNAADYEGVWAGFYPSGSDHYVRTWYSSAGGSLSTITNFRGVFTDTDPNFIEVMASFTDSRSDYGYPQVQVEGRQESDGKRAGRAGPSPSNSVTNGWKNAAAPHRCQLWLSDTTGNAATAKIDSIKLVE